MGIRYSYSDFSTRGHGVIEGASNDLSWNNKVGVLYSFVDSIPKKYEVIDSTDDISTYIKYVLRRNNIVARQLITDIRSGHIVRVGAFVIKRSENGLFDVFHRTPRPTRTSNDKIVTNPKSKKKTAKAVKENTQGSNRTADIYKHLQKVHKKALQKNKNSNIN